MLSGEKMSKKIQEFYNSYVKDYTDEKPAILGGKPEFQEIMPITKPTMPNFEKVEGNFREIFNTGMITNSKFVKLFEEKASQYIGVEHCVAMNSCTAGMLLSEKVWELKGEVILPSFTFSATGHTLLWNNLKPQFVDIEEETYLIDVEKVKEAINGKTSAILAVHIFGQPADVKALQEIAKDSNLKLLFDAAHALGSKAGEKHVGSFGNAECFSLSPTKLVTAAEGGLVSTNDSKLAEKLRTARNYGDSGDYNCRFNGLNARMNELEAILGLASLESVDQNVENRNRTAELYKKELGSVKGISFQKIKPNARTSFKDFSIFVDERLFGMNRDFLNQALMQENIITKKYFFPPLHRQAAYSSFFKEFDETLPVTNKVAENVLSLPLFSHIEEKDVKKVIEAIKKIYENAKEVKEAVANAKGK